MVTHWISTAIATHLKAVPIVLMLLIWFLFWGFRTLAHQKEERLLRELLFCVSVFGLLFSLTFFGCYGLVDPANHLARAGAVPVAPAALARFAGLGYACLAVAIAAGALLELRLRRRGQPA